MRISDWSSDVCSSDLPCRHANARVGRKLAGLLADPAAIHPSRRHEGLRRHVEHDIGQQRILIKRLPKVGAAVGAERDIRPHTEFFQDPYSNANRTVTHRDAKRLRARSLQMRNSGFPSGEYRAALSPQPGKPTGRETLL